MQLVERKLIKLKKRSHILLVTSKKEIAVAQPYHICTQEYYCVNSIAKPDINKWRKLNLNYINKSIALCNFDLIETKLKTK